MPAKQAGYRRIPDMKFQFCWALSERIFLMLHSAMQILQNARIEREGTIVVRSP